MVHFTPQTSGPWHLSLQISLESEIQKPEFRMEVGTDTPAAFLLFTSGFWILGSEFWVLSSKCGPKPTTSIAMNH